MDDTQKDISEEHNEEEENTLEIKEDDAMEISDEPGDDSFDQLVRLTADFENFKKRTRKDRADLLRYGNENLVQEVLPILDNFERAVDHAKSAKDIDSIRTGVEMILHQLLHTLERFGVQSKTSIGADFDPMVHEAVSHIESDNHPENVIVEEHQKAYFLHDRLIRPAMVAVSKSSNETSKLDEEPKDVQNEEE